jgi:tricorn protease
VRFSVCTCRASVFALVCVLAALPSAAAPIRLLRHPDIHDGRIVFSWHGNIWSVAEDGKDPRRLTANSAHDHHPRFSPDGKWIAFSSNRYGNDDVFVMPAAGGSAKRLTFHSGADTVVGWTRDSKHVLFAASRGDLFPGIPNLYLVSTDGGREERVPTDWGVTGSFSPDGKKLAFNRHPAVWWRKHYRGSYSADLWTVDLASKTFTRLLDADLPDNQKPNAFWPMWGKGAIWFVSDRATKASAGSKEVYASVNNIWRIPEGGGAPVQVTHHTSGSLFFPSISSDGKTIVYEEDFRLFRLDTATGISTEVVVDLEADPDRNDPAIVVSRGDLEEFDLSPTTKRAVVSYRGELFTIATDRGDVTRVTRSASRESRPAWSPDGKKIAFVTDRWGRDEVAVSDADGKNVRRLSDADTEKLALAWSPDSKSLAYTSSDRKLSIVDLAEGKTRTLASTDVAAIQLPRFSPDGKWVSYTKLDHDFRPHVHLVAAAGGDEHRLADDLLFASSGAHFTSDGKKLIFLGGFVQAGSATLRDNRAGLYSVSLAREERDPMSRDLDDEKSAEAAEKAAAERMRERARPGAAAAEPKEVLLDWDGLERRIHAVTHLSENVVSAIPSPDGRTYAFVTSSEGDGRPALSIYTVAENGSEVKRVYQASSEEIDPDAPPVGPGPGISGLAFSKDGRTLFFREAQGLWSLALGGAQAAGAEPPPAASGVTRESARHRVNFTLRLDVDGAAERRQIFEESWRVMKNRFYDAAMHGVDWGKVKSKYEPLVAFTGDREELHDLVSMMIGELNASHTGISGGGEMDPANERTRFPGIEFSPDASGLYRVAHVYAHGPADRDYARVKTGDFLLAIDGVPVKSGDNLEAHYNRAAGKRLELTLNAKPTAEGSTSVRVDAVGAAQMATLQYERWVEERRQMTEKLSGGTVGYLHIRQMNAAALRKFERDLADNRFKKALIIDQRFNPGGGIDQELLQILGQRQFQYTKGRDSVPLTRPQRAFFGPMVVMQNERSTSDAEVFPAGFTRLKLGKTVGTTTYGAVIGTGAFRLVDGSQIRTPGTGLWDVNGQNLENYGVPPDVAVDNPPADTLAGGDAQLRRAVALLQEELKAGATGPVTGK